ncbi:MAG: hypothetical protein OWQ54_06190 [Sulfolobaceae archaeon]|nr:hypothetical protein [Sulfolobaceae archaeon]
MRIDKESLVVFSYTFSSIGTLGVTYSFSQGNIIESLLSILIFTPLVYVLYKMMSIQPSEGGLYDQVKFLFPKLSTLFVFFWVFSYFLYLTYTIYFITYYILPLSHLVLILLSSFLIAVIAIIAYLDFELYFLIPVAILQFLVLIPLPNLWIVKPLTFGVNYDTVLSNSLLPVCITLVPFLGNKIGRNLRLFFPTYVIASAFIIADSIFKPLMITYYLTSFTSFGLILAEFFAVKNIMIKRFNVKKSLIVIVFIVLALIGLINPALYYTYLIAVSLPALYVSLIIFFLSVLLYFSLSRKNDVIMIIFSLISIGLVSYGLYSSILLQYVIIQIPVLFAISISASFHTFRSIRKSKSR